MTRPTFALLLEALPPRDGEPPPQVRLKRLVKLLLRSEDFRLRVIDHREVSQGASLTALPVPGEEPQPTALAALQAQEEVERHLETCSGCTSDVYGHAKFCQEWVRLRIRANNLRRVVLARVKDVPEEEGQ